MSQEREDTEVEQDAEFFVPGMVYGTDGYSWRFRCDVVTTHPENGERTALGWRYADGEWDAYAYHDDDWDLNRERADLLPTWVRPAAATPGGDTP